MANVFYSTFLNVFYSCHVFTFFNVFFYFSWNVFYIYGLYQHTFNFDSFLYICKTFVYDMLRLPLALVSPPYLPPSVVVAQPSLDT